MPGPLLRITRMLPILLLACLPVSACAARDTSTASERSWVLLENGADSRLYLDSSRVEIAGGQPIVWLWVDFNKPIPGPGGTAPFWGTRTRHRLDCANRQSDDLQILRLGREGVLVDSSAGGARGSTFADHPLGRSVFPFACQWLGRHQRTGVQAARASEAWTEFYREETMVISADTSRIARAEHGMDLWLRFDSATPVESSATPGQAYSRMDLLQRIDCGGDSLHSVWMRLWDPLAT